MLANSEESAETRALAGPPRVPVVVVITRRGSELPGGRLRPRCRIQYEILVRIDAVAIGIFQEQRLARNPVGESAAEQQCAQVILRE
jgi:hypothetical protein